MVDTGKNKKLVTDQGCWACEGAHYAKNCPNCEKVNVVISRNAQEKEEGTIVAALANPLGLLLNNHIPLVNAMGESPNNPHSSLLHIKTKVNDKGVVAMVDTKTMHTFINVKLAAQFELKLTKSPNYMKTVNQKAQMIEGMAYDMQVVAGPWARKHSLMVIPLGDFDMILGINFLRKIVLF